MKIKKRNYFLMEVLIALALVALCGLPLLAPHLYMIKEERKFSAQVNLDRIVNLLYIEKLEKLYKNDIDWDKIAEGITEPVESELLTNSIYKGTSTIGLVREVDEEGEEKKKEETPHYLIAITFEFKEEGSSKKPIEYYFNIYAKRNVGLPAAATPEENKEEKKEDDPKKAA